MSMDVRFQRDRARLHRLHARLRRWAEMLNELRATVTKLAGQLQELQATSTELPGVVHQLERLLRRRGRVIRVRNRIDEPCAGAFDDALHQETGRSTVVMLARENGVRARRRRNGQDDLRLQRREDIVSGRGELV